MKVGKSTVARLLAQSTGLVRKALDKNRWNYYAEAGYDAGYAESLIRSNSHDALLSYWKPFEVHAVERHLSDKCHCIVDFGAGYSVQDDPELFERVRRVLASVRYVILLTPSPDDEESIEELAPRVTEQLREVNAHYVRHPANRLLAKRVVYTKGKTPDQTCEEILQIVSGSPGR